MRHLTTLFLPLVLPSCSSITANKPLGSDIDRSVSIPGIPKSALVYYPVESDKANFYTSIALNAAKKKYPTVNIGSISEAQVQKLSASTVPALEGDEVKVFWMKADYNSGIHSFIRVERMMEVYMSPSGKVHKITYTDNT